jgi:hypothetical protein
MQRSVLITSARAAGSRGGTNAPVTEYTTVSQHAADGTGHHWSVFMRAELAEAQTLHFDWLKAHEGSEHMRAQST